MTMLPIWQSDEIQARVMEKFQESGVDPAVLLTDWVLGAEGGDDFATLKGTVSIRMPLDEARRLINGDE